MRAKKNYVANLIGEGVFASDLPVDRPDPRPVRVGGEGVLLLYGDPGGGTVVVAAYDADDAERRLVATFSDSPQIDDLQESADQRQLSVAYTAGTVPDSTLGILRLDETVRPYLEEQVATMESLVAAMPEIDQKRYRASSYPHRTLDAIDALVADVLARARPDGPARRRYLDVRFDVSDLSDAEVEALAGEVLAQAEESDGHPSVEFETETVEHLLCAHCGGELDIDDDGHALCDSCETQDRYERAVAGER